MHINIDMRPERCDCENDLSLRKGWLFVQRTWQGEIYKDRAQRVIKHLSDLMAFAVHLFTTRVDESSMSERTKKHTLTLIHQQSVWHYSVCRPSCGHVSEFCLNGCYQRVKAGHPSSWPNDLVRRGHREQASVLSSDTADTTGLMMNFDSETS